MDVLDINEKTFAINDIVIHITDYGLNSKAISLSYESVVNLLHSEIQWFCKYTDDYQGDWFMIGKAKDGKKWFFKDGSFGSCSGCDWLQGIDTKEGAISFFEQMNNIEDYENNNEIFFEKMTERANSKYEEAQNTLLNLINEVKQAIVLTK
jgi:hypothetical protein